MFFFKSKRVKELEKKINEMRSVNKKLLKLIDDKNTEDLAITRNDMCEKWDSNRTCKDCGCYFNTENRLMMDSSYYLLIRDICSHCLTKYETNTINGPSGREYTIKPRSKNEK